MLMNQVNDLINQQFVDHDIENMSDDSTNSEPLCEWNCFFWTICWTIPYNDNRNVSSRNMNWFNGRFNSPDLNHLCDITMIHFCSCKVLLWLKFMKTWYRSIFSQNHSTNTTFLCFFVAVCLHPAAGKVFDMWTPQRLMGAVSLSSSLPLGLNEGFFSYAFLDGGDGIRKSWRGPLSAVSPSPA